MTESAAGMDFEELLSSALRPVDPPDTLTGRLEETFSAVAEAAATELSDWADELTESELESLRDPRNWVRPVVAVAAGGVATGALVVMEARRRSRRRRPSVADRLGDGLQDLADTLRTRI